MGHTHINVTNVSNHVFLEHETIAELSTAMSLVPFMIPIVLIGLYAISHYTKNLALMVGAGLGFIGLAFSAPTITGLSAFDFSFWLLVGLAILYQGFFSYNKIKKGER